MDRAAEPAPDDRQRLRGQIEQFRLVCNNVPVAIAYYERAGNYTCRYANSAYAQMFGRTEDDIVGMRLVQIIGAAAAAEIQPQVDTVIDARQATRYERRIHAGGDVRTIEVHLLPHLDARGHADGAFVLISDITRHRRAEAALRESEERLVKFMHASVEGIVFHKDGVITDVNPPLLALTGYTLDELLGRPALEFVAPEYRRQVADVMNAGREIRYDTAALHRDGTAIPVEFIVRTMVYQGDKLRMTIVRDIRDRVEAQARIEHLAHHDPLTGLPNRMAFDERAQALVAQAQRARESLAVLFIDLDHFKRVNDSLGHAVGDALLRTVAERIKTTLRGADLVARFGGDEFVLLLAGDPTREAVQEVAAKLLGAVGAPVDVEGVSISVTPTIGVALYPAHGATPVELVKHADTAMYRAKAGGRARWCFFEPAMGQAVWAELELEARLAEAVRRSEFVLYYQPQLRLDDGALCGIEALVRWRHPERGLVEPDAFIPVAEARQLILPIGEWVLNAALRTAAQWHASGLARVPIAVNLAPLQFQTPGFVETVERALAATGASGAMLELELTERMLMDDVTAVRDMLLRLRALGVGIAIDDFGTGYTSLRHLQLLPIGRLKIDRSFVAELPAQGTTAPIVRAIIQMAHSLQLRVVAEGVETQAQRDWLQANGCAEQQGYLVARPMPADAMAAWLQAHRRRSGAGTSGAA